MMVLADSVIVLTCYMMVLAGFVMVLAGFVIVFTCSVVVLTGFFWGGGGFSLVFGGGFSLWFQIIFFTPRLFYFLFHCAYYCANCSDSWATKGLEHFGVKCACTTRCALDNECTGAKAPNPLTGFGL